MGVLLLSTVATAGFEGFNNGTNLKLFNGLECKEGMVCERSKNKMQISVDLAGVIASTRAVTAAGSLTSADCGKAILTTTTTAYRLDLPELSASLVGCEIAVYRLAGSSLLTLNPMGSDRILLLTNANGDAIAADTAGESVVLQAISATQWAPKAVYPSVWADAN
jgi:hypothetical protein